MVLMDLPPMPRPSALGGFTAPRAATVWRRSPTEDGLRPFLPFFLQSITLSAEAPM